MKKRKAMTLLYLLGRHSGAEEMLVYSYLHAKLPGGGQLAERFKGAHTQLHADLKQLDKNLGGASPNYSSIDSRLATVMRDMESHATEEEATLLPLMEKHCSGEELREMGERFLTAELAATSRPHPAAPKAGVAAVMAHVSSKPLDMLRDLASGRNAEIEEELKQFNLTKV